MGQTSDRKKFFIVMYNEDLAGLGELTIKETKQKPLESPGR